MKNKGFIVIVITYILARLAGSLTGIRFDPFSGNFDVVLLLKDITIWILSYVVARLIVYSISKSKAKSKAESN